MWRSKSCICEWNSLFNFFLEHIEYKYKGRVQFFLSTVCFCRVFAYLIHEKIGIEKWTSGNSLTSFPPLHAKFIFHALSNALSSTKFEWETVGLQSLDKLRIYQCFFFAILQRNLAIIYDVEEWETHCHVRSHAHVTLDSKRKVR